MMISRGPKGVAVISGFENRIVLYSYARKRVICNLSWYPDASGRIAVSSDEQKIALGSWRCGVALFNAENGRKIWHREDVRKMDVISIDLADSLIFVHGADLEPEPGTLILDFATGCSVTPGREGDENVVRRFRSGDSKLLVDKFDEGPFGERTWRAEAPISGFTFSGPEIAEGCIFGGRETILFGADREYSDGMSTGMLNGALGRVDWRGRGYVDLLSMNRISCTSVGDACRQKDGVCVLLNEIDGAEGGAFMMYDAPAHKLVPISKCQYRAVGAFIESGEYFLTSLGDVIEIQSGEILDELDLESISDK